MAAVAKTFLGVAEPTASTVEVLSTSRAIAGSIQLEALAPTMAILQVSLGVSFQMGLKSAPSMAAWLPRTSSPSWTGSMDRLLDRLPIDLGSISCVALMKIGPVSLD